MDALLRGGVLVDLYRVVRQGIRASVESYSIKRLEPLYGFTREVDLQRRREQHRRVRDLAGDRRRGRLAARRSSTGSSATTATTSSRPWLLRDWLEARRGEARGRAGGADPAPGRRLHRAVRGAVREDPAHAGAGRSPVRRRPRRSGRTDARSSTPAGCWPSSWPGTGARTRPSGGATSTCAG